MTEILLEGHTVINIGQDKEQGLLIEGLSRVINVGTSSKMQICSNTTSGNSRNSSDARKRVNKSRCQ